MTLKKNFLLMCLFVSTLSIISCSKDDEDVMEQSEEEVAELASFMLYENVEFEVDTEGLDSKRFFSTITGSLYTYNEIDAEIAPTIDLAWYDMSP